MIIVDKKGQSTIEFALSMILFISFLFFFFQLSMFFGFANYTHYAVYMSARAFLSAGADKNDQQARATAVIVSLLKKTASEPGIDKFPSFAKGVGEGLPIGLEIISNTSSRNSGLDWMNGVRYTFQGKLFIIPLSGLGKNASTNNFVTLTAESFLGRDPPYDECQTDLGIINGIFDNGC
jgi:hypothetical protein